MKTTDKTKRLTPSAALLFFFMLIAFSPAALAQQQPAISAAVYDPATGFLEVIFTGNIVKEQLPARTNITLLNYKDTAPATDSIKKIPVSQVAVRRGIISIDPAVMAGFVFPADLKKEPISIIILLRPDLKKDDVIVLSAMMRDVRQENRELGREEPKGRDDANLYVSGEIVAAHNAKPVYSTDIKYEKTFGLRALPVRIGPFLSLKANTSPKADPDQFRGGLKFVRNVWTSNAVNSGENTCLLCLLRYEGTGELEADREFRVKNLITSQHIRFLFRNFYLSSKENSEGREIRKADRVLMRFTPSVGAEFGRNLSSPVRRDERRIGRLVSGITLEMVFPKTPLQSLGFRQITWENTFARRWFLTNEMAYDKNKDGSLKLVEFGRRPRSYFQSKFNLKINEFFGPTISYEWGELPPLYNKVDHQVKLGFTYSYKEKTAN